MFNLKYHKKKIKQQLQQLKVKRAWKPIDLKQQQKTRSLLLKKQAFFILFNYLPKA